MFKKYKEDREKISHTHSLPKDIKLTYFDGRGRGEGIRYILAEGGIKYEDHRVTQETWSSSLKAKTVLGVLPMVEVNGCSIAQSVAVGRYTAKLAGLYGNDSLDDAIIDMIVDTANEFREGAIAVLTMKCEPDEKEKALTTFVEEKAKPQLANLETIFASNGGQYFVENKISFADIWFFACLELVIKMAKMPDILKPFENLCALYTRIGESTRIAKYIENRPETSF